MRNRIIVACAGVPAILLVLYLLPEPFTPAMIAVLSAIGTYEAMGAMGMNHPRLALYTAAMAMAIPFWVYFGEKRILGLLVLLAYLVLIFLEAFASSFRVKVEKVGAAFFFALFIAYCLSSVVRVGNLYLRDYYIALPIFLPFIVDAAAMLTGMHLGRRSITPNLSPHKTLEGCIGGLVFGIAACLLYGLGVHLVTGATANYYFLAVYGLLGGIMTQIGDLAFSYIKRTRKIKDFSGLLPGHGGVLDRFDSVIFCAPLVELLIHYFPAFRLG